MKKLLSILLSLTVFVGATTPNACFAAEDNKPQTTVQSKSAQNKGVQAVKNAAKSVSKFVANNAGKIAIGVSVVATVAYLTANAILTNADSKSVYNNTELAKMEKALAIAKNLFLGMFNNKDVAKVVEDKKADSEVKDANEDADKVQDENVKIEDSQAKEAADVAKDATEETKINV